MLKIENIYKTFNIATANEKKALKGLSLNVEAGDFITVLGSNGAGKSTMLNAIAGVFMVDSGKIILDNEDITKQQEHKRARNIGRLFQDPMKGTAPNMTIAENLGLAYSRGTRRSLSWGIKKKDLSFFKEILSQLELGLEDRLDTKVKLLSGGQRQALTLIMATIKTPKLLLLDEHTAALDPITASKVMEITNKIINKDKISTIMITHNIEQALNYGNKTIMLNDGRVAYEISEDERKNMTAKELLELYTKKLGENVSDEMLFSIK